MFWFKKKIKEKVEKNKKITQRKCLGHVHAYLRNSKLRKGWTEEQRRANLQDPILDKDGICQVCGGRGK